MDDRLRVASAVRAHFGAAGLSASAVAREIGITQSKMSRRTTGAEPFDIDELSAIARVLHVELVDLITGTNLPARPLRVGAGAGARRHLYLVDGDPEAPASAV
ncbi:helix-turn-helix domain-containing protein [Microbacterium sp. YJN-G]|uniref:helix-turn-helix domain-containing protein n=1 Tax=Microbacterium sp. YJN-G TaxID=2763257 RepID=UPI001877B87A|nr:helix-turn-helix transcriptional regulator [Microbacterium sp. YJN-G]